MGRISLPPAKNEPSYLEDVVLKKSMVAGIHPVALDAYVAKAFWNLDVSSFPCLRLAASGLRTYEFEKTRVRVKRLDGASVSEDVNRDLHS